MFGDVASANVVGYAGSKLDEDFGTRPTVALFVDCGSSTAQIKLGNIKPVPGQGSLTADDIKDNVSFQMIDGGGYTIDGTTRYWNGSIWTDESFADKSEETYPAGTGFNVANGCLPLVYDGGDVIFQSSGEVNQKNVLVQLDTDFGTKLTGNPFPVAIKLKDIIPVSTEDTAGNISYQKLDGGGYTIDGSTRYWNGSIWTDESFADMSEEELQPGEGICVANMVLPAAYDGADAFLRFVAPSF